MISWSVAHQTEEWRRQH